VDQKRIKDRGITSVVGGIMHREVPTIIFPRSHLRNLGKKRPVLGFLWLKKKILRRKIWNW